jgi:hypothetical protein
MAYSKYKNVKLVVKRFNLQIVSSDLFVKDIQLLEPSPWLVQTLEMMTETGFDTEKERSERLLAPIFAELRHRNNNQMTIYSGHELNADPKNDLNGECDYLLALGKKVHDFVETPIFSVVEAKKQDFDLGTGQCSAQMVGAMKYNEMDGNPTSKVYGAATDGVKWRFLKLEDNVLHIDSTYYVTENLSKLLGILQFIFNDCKKKP